MQKIQREKDALEALEAVEAYVRERLTDARLEAKSLRENLTKVENSIKILENRANTLQISKVHWITPTEETPKVPPTPDALQVIQSIMESTHGRMRARMIAEYAHSKGLIASSRGLEGVVSIVGNKLSQNSPTIFTSVGWGWWDLTERARESSKIVAKLRKLTAPTPITPPVSQDAPPVPPEIAQLKANG
jgi:hypothetical protein